MNYNIKISELNKLNPHMTPGLNGTQVTLMEGERSRSHHPCTPKFKRRLPRLWKQTRTCLHPLQK